jgi:hypothetical protein
LSQLWRGEAAMLLQNRWALDNGELLSTELDAQQRRGYARHPFDVYSNATARQQCAAFLLANDGQHQVPRPINELFHKSNNNNRLHSKCRRVIRWRRWCNAFLCRL